MFQNLHPHFGEPPGFVEPELAAPYVRGVVDLQNHVRNVVLADHHGGRSRQLRTPRSQVHGLIRLHDAPRFAVLAAQQQVHRTVPIDRRPAHAGDPVRQRGQHLRGRLLVGAGRLVHPRGPGGGVPELQSSLEVADLLTCQAVGRAAGRLQRRRRRPCRQVRRCRMRRPPLPRLRFLASRGLGCDRAVHARIVLYGLPEQTWQQRKVSRVSQLVPSANAVYVTIHTYRNAIFERT